MKLKAGVQATSLHPAVEGAMDVVDAFWREAFGRQVTITSVSDGAHSEGSLHYGVAGDTRARAFDVRTRNLDGAQKAQARHALRRLLGEVFDVVLKTTHAHIEYDEKNISRIVRGT